MESFLSSSFYIGTYVNDSFNSNSIFYYDLNVKNLGEMRFISASKGGPNPSYVIVDNKREYLYSVNEEIEEEGGFVSSYKISKVDGSLSLVSKQICSGYPCHLSLDKEENHLLVASFAGSISIFPICNGEIKEASKVIQHYGSSINKERQEKAHCHYITVDPTQQYVFVVDLGIDKILSYDLKNLLSDKKEEVISKVAFSTKPGSGPRHMLFNSCSDNKFAYLLNELDSTVTALSYNSLTGTFVEVQTISTLPNDYDNCKLNFCSAIRISNDGKFLYASNRGHNSIVVYKIDIDSGKLTNIQYEFTNGEYPRDFNIDPSGSVMIVANHHSDNVLTFTIDKTNGMLKQTDYKIEIPKPVCICNL